MPGPENPGAQKVPEAQTLLLGTLLELEKELRHAGTQAELAYVLANETLRLVRFGQALVWTAGLRIQAVSGVDTPDRNAPYTLFCRSLVRHVLGQEGHRKIRELTREEFPQTFHADWQEWFDGTLLWVPLISPQGEMAGGLIFSREEAWNQGEMVLLERLADAGAHALKALGRRQGLFRGVKNRWIGLAVAALMLLVLALPVHLSVLAPVEIVPRDPLVVSAPMDGVVRTIHVAPSQAVTKGTLLFSLDDTRLRNEHQVAVKALEVGRAELNRARQKAFMDARSKADLNLLRARVRQKTVEAAYWEELLSKSRILAERDGIVVFGDPGDWEGRPVVVGEKVMTIADPNAVEARIELPVADAIVLAPGARVLIFLNIRPQDPYPAVLVQSGYKAVITQDEVLAFSLKAALSAEKNTPRIGLRGTAKLFGEEVRVAYYLFRKPLAAARQMLGV